MTSRASLSIVIVSHNAAGDLRNCLASLAAAPPSLPHDIIVVDNRSADGSVALARRMLPGGQVIALDENLGFAAANNVGIRATRGELLLLLNSDTIVPPKAIDRLCARLADHPDAAVAGPRLVDAAGRAELSFGPMLSPLVELRRKTAAALYARGVGPVARWIDRTTRLEQFVDWVSGACLLVLRKDAEAVGLLDERFFMYTEDVDFCAAIRRQGRRILFAPAAEITHLRGRSAAAAPAATNRAYRRSQLAFYEKHHPRWAPVLRLYLRLKGAAQ